MSNHYEALDLAQRAETGVGGAPDTDKVLERARKYLAFLEGAEQAQQKATYKVPASGAFRG